MSKDYISRMLPLIDRAAEVTRERAKKVILNGHILWQVYTQEKSRLVDEAARVQSGKPLRSGETMSEAEFERYLIDRGVWVEYGLTSDDD